MEPPYLLSIEDAAFRSAVDLLDAGDVDGLRRHLRAQPRLACERASIAEPQYFRNPALLEFIAENPVRRGVLPPNIVEVAKAILNAGAADDITAVNRALSLVSSGRVARECRSQIPLIELLTEYGGDPNGALKSALGHGEFEAVDALLRRGARMNLSVAAARGQTEVVRELVPQAGGDERHCALALASQFGHREAVWLLLDAGEDPNRFNPAGLHAHSTPLHQAAFAGHLDVVRLLILRGARLDVRDTVWHGTPADWAQHGGRSEIAGYLASLKREPPSNELVSTSQGKP